MPLTLIAEIPNDLFQPVGLMAEAGLRTGRDSMPAKKAARFPRAARLLRHADFERVYKQGRRHFSATMTVFYLGRPEADGKDLQPLREKRAGVPALHGLRVGFTVGRALGGAVQRNRMKRRLREAVRMTRPANGIAADVVINPKKAILIADFAEVVKEVARAFGVVEQKLGANGLNSKSSRTEASAPHEA